MIHITMRTNIPHVSGRISKWPNKMEKSAHQIARVWAKAVQKSAKLRAPRNTGTLVKNIEARGVANKTWSIGVYGPAYRYGRYVERGFSPHWVPIEYLEQHENNPGAKGQFVANPRAFIYLRGTAQPFIGPALLATRSNLKDMFNKAINDNFGGR